MAREDEEQITRMWDVVGKQRLFLGGIVTILGTSVSVQDRLPTERLPDEPGFLTHHYHHGALTLPVHGWLSAIGERIALLVMTSAGRRFAHVPVSVSGHAAEQRLERWGIANVDCDEGSAARPSYRPGKRHSPRPLMVKNGSVREFQCRQPARGT
ncbi:hypothetical protein AtubIFM55763_002535 [Aspergillus tubingensis]|nr:hypothetical protein AtubIFM55763_002535 [Aspergillus tubingensis]